MDFPQEMDGKENTWVTFHEPSPALVRARFNITQIEVPLEELKDGKGTDSEFLQMLIGEGIPVKVVPPQDIPDTSNAGVIMHQPSLNESTENSDVVVLMGPQDDPSQEAATLLSQSVTNMENAIEVTGANKPISKPLFLHYAPTLPDTAEDPRRDLRKSIFKRRLSLGLTVDGPIGPRSVTGQPNHPIKKSVRFNLPERKGSIVGVYEYFPVAAEIQKISKLSKQRHNKAKVHMNNKKPENTTKEPRTRKKSPSSKDVHKSNKSDIDTDLQVKIDNYYLDIDLESCITPADRISTLSSVTSDSSRGSSKRSEDSHDEDDDSDEDQSDVDESYDKLCGLAGCTPRFMQRYARKEMYFMVFCIISLLQGMLYTYSNSVISTLEKRFSLSRKSTGIILAGTDLSQILFAMIIGFYGSYGHVPRWMGMGALLSAAAASLAALPHFIYGDGQQAKALGTAPQSPFQTTPADIELCGLSPRDQCDVGQDASQQYVFVAVLLFVSQCMIGVASCMFWTVGLAFLDDNINKKKSPLYLTIFTIVRMVGPTLGFLLGGYCLTFWINPQHDMPLSTRDPRWFGAWWLGFLILSACLCATGVVYFCFPRHITHESCHTGFEFLSQSPVYEPQAPKNVSHKSQSSDTCPSQSQSSGSIPKWPPINDFPKSVARLFRNRIWTANLFSNIMFVMAFSGYWKFKPKYIEHQFRKSASVANFYTGMATMVSSVCAIGLSGLVLRWGRPRPKYVTGYNVFLSVFAVVSLFVLMTMHCTSVELAGHIPQKETWACSKHCSCSEEYHPVCAEDGRTVFYSPCYAGCSAVNVLVSPMEFTNCSCIGRVKWRKVPGKSKENDVMEPTLEEGWALQGFCPEECKSFLFFIGFQVFTKMIFSTGRVGGTLINLRAVEERDKSLALGCMTALITLFGFVPASFFTGNIIDSACLVWQEKCGQRGECWFYDNKKFRLLMHIVPAGLLILSGLGDLIVYLNHNKLDLYGEEENILPIQNASSQKSCVRHSATGPQISSPM